MPVKKKSPKPAQRQKRQPGIEKEMTPRPVVALPEYRGSGKLEGKVALITGGDSGIGRAVAVLFAREGADVSVLYLDEHQDAEETKRQIEAEGQKCLLLPGDVRDEKYCKRAVKKTVDELGRLDVVVNNAAEQHVQNRLEDISAEQLEKTFRTNIFSMFYITKAALAHLKKGASIINTSSITAYRGNPSLIDYSSTKGAIVAFTRALAQSLAERGIRVNGVAPGPIWTPLIPATFPEEKVAKFGTDTPMSRPGEPAEVAPAYVFLAASDASYITGQFIHVNGGDFISS